MKVISVNCGLMNAYERVKMKPEKKFLPVRNL